MTLDIAMGGSTNTGLHLLAAARRPASNFTMADIDRLSRRVPCLCKVAPTRPTSTWRTCTGRGGIMAILGELDRAGCCTEPADRPCPTLGEALDHWDIARAARETVRRSFRAAPGGVPTQVPRSARTAAGTSLDTDRASGVIRGDGARLLSHRWRPGRAVRQSRRKGCIVKTAGVDEAS